MSDSTPARPPAPDRCCTRSSGGLSRRAVIAAGAGLAAVAALPACATYGSSGPPPARPAPAGGTGEGSAPLARTTDVPVGGGTVFPDRQVVVTQPAPGTFAAFDTTCPHQGCAVAEVTGGTIRCPCHGSTFRIEDGAVTGGPATRPLSPRDIAVADGALTLA